MRNAIIAVLAFDRRATLWDAARLLSVGEEGYAYRRAVSRRIRALPTFIERPNYFDVSVFGAAAESVARYLGKGSRIGIDGRLEWREWESEQGHRQAVSIVADVVQFLDGPSRGNEREGADEPLAGGGELGAGDLVGVGAEDVEVGF